MTGMLDSVRDYAQSHPMTVAAGLIIALPGTYLYITGKSITCAAGRCGAASSPSESPAATFSRGLSIYDAQHPLDWRLKLPISKWSDKPTSTYILQVIEGTRSNVIYFLNSLGERLGVDLHDALRIFEDRWATHFPFSRFASVAVATALPGAFLVFIRNHPKSWAARHQTQIANALHVLALVTVANQRISVQDLLVAALVMVSFEAFQRTLGHQGGDAPAALETLLSQTHSVNAKSDIVNSSTDDRRIADGSIADDFDFATSNGSTSNEMMRLQKALAEVRTAEKAKEHDLQRTQTDLRNARETLNETFAEYTSLRDEMKTVKQTIGRDHQAVVYRKDIELFALRKANEQKENYIKERDTKLEEIYRQQKASLELKDTQLRSLKERIAYLERQDSPKMNEDGKLSNAMNGDQAVQVKLLRVKGRNSSEVERTSEEKDIEILKLREELDAVKQSDCALEKTQDEVRRAWDAAYDAQRTLNEERALHAQTQEKLQQAAVQFDEELRRSSQKSSPTTRLPTIEEQDKHELESMFNAAQQDNLRLYAEVEALEKRVREANARTFTSEQESEALRDQLQLEKAINEDMETARPSLVHRVHFQRMEGQLKAIRDELTSKDEEIERLKKDLASKDSQVEKLEKEKVTVASAQTQLENDNKHLKESVAQLESTKEQLMLDHERLASQRARQRTSSAEHTSARSSGATLITDSSQIITNAEEPMPARPVSIPADSSIQGTPERHIRNDTNRLSLISNDLPPPELRTSRRKSLTLKGLMRKIAGKEGEVEGEEKVEKPTKAKDDKKQKDKDKEKEKEKEKERPKTAKMPLAPKDKNTLIRPKTSAAAEPQSKKALSTEKGKEVERPKANGTVDQRPKTAALPEKAGKKTSPRYYANEGDAARPKTSGAPLSEGMLEGNENGSVAAKAKDADAASPRPKSRGWSTSRKLVRKSIA